MAFDSIGLLRIIYVYTESRNVTGKCLSRRQIVDDHEIISGK